MANLALVFFLVAVVFSPCFGQLSVGSCECSDATCRSGQTEGKNRPCCKYTDQPNQMTVASLSDPNGTPLGFSTDLLPAIEDTSPRPCVAVEFSSPGSVNYISVVMQSYLQDNTVCAYQEDGEDTATCTEGLLGHFCEQATISSNNYTIIEFDCTGGSCENSEFSFYFKIETASLDTDDEFWCSNRNTTIPFSLIFNNQTFNTVTPDLTDPTSPTTGAMALISCVPLLLLTLLLGWFLMS